MNGKMNFSKTDLKNLKKLQQQSKPAFRKALEIGGIQLLTWMNTGAGGTRESRKPPIRFGVLRGSSSIFVGKNKVQDFQITIKPGAKEQISPANSANAKENTITIVYNTDYAWKMEEWEGDWGQYTEQDGNAGNKWIEKHLQADKDLLMKVISNEFGKAARL